jgi:hypothetical protein
MRSPSEHWYRTFQTTHQIQECGNMHNHYYENLKYEGKNKSVSMLAVASKVSLENSVYIKYISDHMQCRM